MTLDIPKSHMVTVMSLQTYKGLADSAKEVMIVTGGGLRRGESYARRDPLACISLLPPKQVDGGFEAWG